MGPTRRRTNPVTPGALLAALLTFALTLAASASAEAWDPNLRWWTLETEHFVIHYPDRLGDLPARIAEYCEEAHAVLVPVMEHTPEAKTHVVVDDTVDTANGFANVIPRNAMQIFVYGPESRSVLGDYDDWLRLLILHEYTHILHIDTISGIPRWLNLAFGTTIAPNQLLPRWYIEGLATWRETQHTGGGRVRSSLFHMYLRAAWRDGALFDIGTLSGIPQAWPRGSSWYLYGSHFIDYIARTRGTAWMGEYHRRIGKTLLPYGVNNTLREIIGEDFVGLYKEWLAYLAGRFEAEALALRLKGLTAVEDVTTAGQTTEIPRLRPHHRQVTFYTNDGVSDPGIYAQELDTGEVHRLVEINNGGGPHDWDPTGRFVVYHAFRVWRRHYNYNDIVLHDTQTQTARFLTRGSRARDPIFDPRGGRVAFIQTLEGRTELVALDLTSGQERVLWRHEGLGQLDTPSWSPDGRFIALSWWREHHERDLYLLDVERGAMLQLTADAALDLDPSWSADGTRVLFSSDRTRVYDIYAADLSALRAGDAPDLQPGQIVRVEAPIRRLTRTTQGLFGPLDVPGPREGDPHQLYLLGFDQRGFNLARTPVASLLHEDAPPSWTRPLVEYPTVSTPAPTQAQPYEPWRHLAPLTVFPLLAFTNAGRNSYGVEVTGFDPVGFHSYTAFGEYFPDTEMGLLFTAWSYRGWPVDLSLAAQYSNYERARGLVRHSEFVPFQEEAYDAQLSLSLPLGDTTWQHNLSLSYNLRFTGVVELPEVAHDPADVTPRDPDEGNFSSLVLNWSIGNTDAYARSITTEQGGRLSLTLRLRDELTLADVHSVELRYLGSFYLANPLLDNHVLALRASGGIGRSDFLRRELFSIGGPPPQEPITALINEAPLGGAFLRGFAPFSLTGEQFHTASAEYRFPILTLDTGFDTLPLFLGRITGGVFTDAGTAFNGDLNGAQWRIGSGAELHLTMTLGYTAFAVLTLGYAHGFGGEGVDDLYFFVGQVF